MARRIRKSSRRRAMRRVELLEERQLLAADPFKIVMLPDTQTLTQSAPATFHAQTQWVADNVQTENIVFLSHVGDLVKNSASEAEWQVADAAMRRLDGDPILDPDGLLPYGVAIGNHDFDDENSHNGSTQFTKYFGEARYAGKSWYGGSSSDQLNHFQIFSAGDQPLLHLTVEWEPRDDAINWAQGILDAYADVPTILTTHAYIDENGVHSDQQLTSDGRSGGGVFQDLVSLNEQIFMVLGGHFGPERHQVSVNTAGSDVIEILANYQGRPIGEDGFLRLIEFDPAADLLNFTTYSPTLDMFEVDADSQFSLPLDFEQRFDLAAPPRARLVGPADNGVGDLDALVNTVTINSVQPSLEIAVLDFSGDVDDSTVIGSSLTLRKDGQLLTETVDYAFSYDSVANQISLQSTNGSFDNGTYEVALSAGASKVRDQFVNEMAPVLLGVTIDTSIPDPPNSLYFSVNTNTTIAGELIADSEDIVYFDGDSFSLYFDGSDVGLAGFTLDALDIVSENEILFSTTGSGTIAGIAGTVDDSDIVKFTATQLGEGTSGTFELYFDGSDVGLSSSGEDIDAIDLLDDGRVIVSTRGSYNTGTISGSDEDLIVFLPTSLGEDTDGTWQTYIDGSDVGLGGEDIDGVSVYANGNIYLSIGGSFELVDSTVRDDDVFVFSPSSMGEVSSGNIVLPFFLDGSLHQLSSADIMSIDVPLPISGNRPPTGNPDVVSVDEGASTAQLSNGSLSLLDNDTDADLPDDTLTVNATPVLAPVHGSLQLYPDGTFSYAHDGSENLSDSFVYEVSDAAGATDTAAVSIVVAPVNDNAPEANDDSMVVARGGTGTELVGGASSLIANDSDNDLPNDALSVNTVPIVLPNHGTVTLDADGTFSYSHDGGTSSADSFTYELVDAAGATNTAVVSISITAVNTPPTASDGQITTLEDTPLAVMTGDFNFSDADGDSLAQIQVTALPSVGTLRLSNVDVALNQVIDVSDLNAGNLLYVPAANATDADSFGFRVHDGTEYSQSANALTIDVTAVNDAPVLSGLPDVSLTEGQSNSTIDLDTYYSDVETPSGSAVFSVISSFAGVTVSIDPATHVLTITGDPGFVGEGDVTIEVTDTGDGASPALTDSDTIHVSVLPDNGETVLLLGVDRNTIIGGISAANEDILVFDGTQFEMLFDGSDVGIDAARLDAFALLSQNEILLSFTTPQTIPGIVDTVDDSDVVKFTGTQFGDLTNGSFELYFDGSDVGLDGSGHDIDAIEILSDGRLIVSITGSETVQGMTVRDDDLVAFTSTSLGETTAGTWELYFDGSDVGLSPEDLHGVAIDSNGDLWFNVQSDFVVGPIAGEDEDVFVFAPATLGTNTSGTFNDTLAFDGSVHGIVEAELSGIELTTATSLPLSSAGTSTAATLLVTISTHDSNSNGVEPTGTPPATGAGTLNVTRESLGMTAFSVDQIMALDEPVVIPFGDAAETDETINLILLDEHQGIRPELT